MAAAAHDVAVVAAASVVVLEPALELGAQVGQASQVLAVEGGPGELLERGALEAFAVGVVVGRAGRDAVVVDAEVHEVVGEPTAGELRAVVGQHPGELGADAGQPLGDVVDKGSGIPRGLVARTG